MNARNEVVHVDSPTEQRNPRTIDIDLRSTTEILELINAEDHRVPAAVRLVLPQLAIAVDSATQALRAGNRVHYVGAGTSGRLATLDAAELVPTFNVSSDLFVAHHAGGVAALSQAVENAEDDGRAGAEEMASQVQSGDFVLGVTASGRTPYVLGSLIKAKQLGAKTALISGNPLATQPSEVDTVITVDTGPEVIAGSTRMKAATAQKIILTAFSTAIMIKLGHTYSNLMVDVRATNAKLRGRILRILVEATGIAMSECEQALTEADGDLKVALVRLIADTSTSQAHTALSSEQGNVRKALAALGS